MANKRKDHKKTCIKNKNNNSNNNNKMSNKYSNNDSSRKRSLPSSLSPSSNTHSTSQHYHNHHHDPSSSSCHPPPPPSDEVISGLQFDDAFAPLAYHLFPDGCPPLSVLNNNNINNNTNTDIASIWPQRQDRKIINTSNDAIVAIKNLERIGKTTGFTTSQQDAILFVACSLFIILPPKQQQQQQQDNDEIRKFLVKRTALRNNANDGSTSSSSSRSYFRRLLKSILPQKQQSISKYFVMKLLSTCTTYQRKKLHFGSNNRNSNDNSRSNSNDYDYVLQIICILQFLTLAIRNGALSEEAKQCLYDCSNSTNSTTMYSIIFFMAFDANLCSDAVRLLHIMTRKYHVKMYRIQRIQQLLLHISNNKNNTKKNSHDNYNFTPLWLLYKLFITLNPQQCCGNKMLKQLSNNYNKTTTSSSSSRWFSFPNAAWERHFNRIWHRDTDTTNVDLLLQNNSNSVSSTVVTTLRRVADSIEEDEGDHIFTTSFGFVYNNSKSKKQKLRASDILQDKSLSHLLVLSTEEQNQLPINNNNAKDVDNISKNNNNNNSHSSSSATTTWQQTVSLDVARLRVCLPFLLQEEWYQPSSSNSNINRNTYYTETLREEDASDQSNSSNSDRSVASMDGGDSRSSKNGEYDVENFKTGDSCDENDLNAKHEHLMSPLHKSESSLLLIPKDGERKRSRLRILKALALVALQRNTIHPEAETMLINEVLPAWDGTEEWGTMLCYDILPCVSVECNFSNLRERILNPLEKFIIYGNNKIQFAMFSGTLASLVIRLSEEIGKLIRRGKEQAADTTNNGFDDELSRCLRTEASAKRQLLEELIGWTDDKLHRAFLFCGNGPSELLSNATIDFFHVVCHNVCMHCNLLILPNTALVYHLLLSKTSYAINGICQLLVDYKGSFQSLKSKFDNQSELLGVKGLDQVSVFNGLAWDFCSMLWRNSPLNTTNPTGLTVSILFTDLSNDVMTNLNEEAWRSAFSITHGAAFAMYAHDFLLGLQDTTGNDVNSIDLIEGKTKENYLDYLKEKWAMDGLYAFLTNFIGSLAKREKRRNKLRANQPVA